MYGFTPPKKKNGHEKIVEISKRRMERLKNISIDGLVIYDNQDEADRTFGFNIESVSIKKDEVLSSFDLVDDINAELKKSGIS